MGGTSQAATAPEQPRVVCPIKFPFDERRALDAAAVLLSHAGGRMRYLRLIKLLYLADRESIDRRGRPIVGGRYVSMDYGPVLSEVLTLVKRGERPGSVWSAAIRTEHYEVSLESKPDLGSISQEEIDLLIEAAEIYKKLDQWKLCDMTHGLPEWKDPKGSAIDISPEDILRALGRQGEEVEESRQAATERAFFEELFGH
jgi:uncharacterized phage-associated protein